MDLILSPTDLVQVCLYILIDVLIIYYISKLNLINMHNIVVNGMYWSYSWLTFSLDHAISLLIQVGPCSFRNTFSLLPLGKKKKRVRIPWKSIFVIHPHLTFTIRNLQSLLDILTYYCCIIYSKNSLLVMTMEMLLVLSIKVVELMYVKAVYLFENLQAPIKSYMSTTISTHLYST